MTLVGEEYKEEEVADEVAAVVFLVDWWADTSSSQSPMSWSVMA